MDYMDGRFICVIDQTAMVNVLELTRPTLTGTHLDSIGPYDLHRTIRPYGGLLLRHLPAVPAGGVRPGYHRRLRDVVATVGPVGWAAADRPNHESDVIGIRVVAPEWQAFARLRQLLSPTDRRHTTVCGRRGRDCQITEIPAATRAGASSTCVYDRGVSGDSRCRVRGAGTHRRHSRVPLVVVVFDCRLGIWPARQGATVDNAEQHAVTSGRILLPRGRSKGPRRRLVSTFARHHRASPENNQSLQEPCLADGHHGAMLTEAIPEDYRTGGCLRTQGRVDGIPQNQEVHCVVHRRAIWHRSGTTKTRPLHAENHGTLSRPSHLSTGPKQQSNRGSSPLLIPPRRKCQQAATPLIGTAVPLHEHRCAGGFCSTAMVDWRRRGLDTQSLVIQTGKIIIPVLVIIETGPLLQHNDAEARPLPASRYQARPANSTIVFSLRRRPVGSGIAGFIRSGAGLARSLAEQRQHICGAVRIRRRFLHILPVCGTTPRRRHYAGPGIFTLWKKCHESRTGSQTGNRLSTRWNRPGRYGRTTQARRSTAAG